MIRSLREETLAPIAIFAPASVIPSGKQSHGQQVFPSAPDTRAPFRQQQKWAAQVRRIPTLLVSRSAAVRSARQNEALRCHRSDAQSRTCSVPLGTNESSHSLWRQGGGH